MCGGKRIGVLGNSHKHRPALQDGGMRRLYQKPLPRLATSLLQGGEASRHGRRAYQGSILQAH
jgi:hypothetical protein